MTESNNRQVGGNHYKADIEHWDWVSANNLDYFQGQITRYIARHKKKGGQEDLEKALHFLEKYIELEYPTKNVEIHVAPAQPQGVGIPDTTGTTQVVIQNGEPGPTYIDPDLDQIRRG